MWALCTVSILSFWIGFSVWFDEFIFSLLFCLTSSWDIHNSYCCFFICPVDKIRPYGYSMDFVGGLLGCHYLT